MNKEFILEKIKEAKSQRFITNCYSLNLIEKITAFWENDNEFIFSYNDNNIKRLVFFAKNWNTVDSLIKLIDVGHYYLEFLAKDECEYIPANAVFVAKMKRMSNFDCRNVFKDDSCVIKYKDAVTIENAQVIDADEINNILWSTFKTEISHLLSNDDLVKVIKNGNITVHKNKKGCIDALLQVDIFPKKFYINQIINKSEKKVIHALLLKRLEQYVQLGGKYLYAWVEEKNFASIKFHEKYGMVHDGMLNMIYSVER